MLMKLSDCMDYGWEWLPTGNKVGFHDSSAEDWLHPD